METAVEAPGKLRMILSVLCNALIVLLTSYSVMTFYVSGGEGNMTVMGSYCFRFFTVDSNILAALASLAMLLSKAIRKETVPKWVLLLKAVGSTAVGVTFVTVMCFLGPMMGYGPMLEGSNLFMHLITPLLAMVSFVLLEREPPMRTADCLWCVLPTLVYGAVYFYEVIIVSYQNGGWFDFYGFNMGGMWYLSAVVMLLGTWVLALLLRVLRKKRSK